MSETKWDLPNEEEKAKGIVAVMLYQEGRTTFRIPYWTDMLERRVWSGNYDLPPWNWRAKNV